MFRRFYLDWQIVIPAVMLSLLSLSILKSVYPQLFLDQFIFLITGLGIFILFTLIDFEILFSVNLITYCVLFLLLLLPIGLGEITRGANRWVQFGFFVFQPSEILKPFYLISMASAAFQNISTMSLKFILLGLLPVIIIFFQPDLGTSLVLVMGLLVTLIFKIKPKILLFSLLLMLVLVFPVYMWGLKTYQQNRIRTFINPYTDPLGQGYHVIQSTIAVGSGGLTGKGLGSGTQTQLKFLPEAHTDFIFASLSEEFGFIGSMIIITLYLILFRRIYLMSQLVSDGKISLFLIASLTSISFQTIVNIGMNIGLLPITGVTLPLLSYGGSSIISIAIFLGVINGISRDIKTKTYLEIK